VASKKKQAEHVNHERWLVSYADFITLLFAFFVVMFAVSQVDAKKMGRFTESFAKAVGIEVFPQSGKSVLPAGGEKPPVQDHGDGSDLVSDDLADLKATLLKKSKDMPGLSGLQVIQRRNELVLRLSDSVVFDTGDDRVKEPGRQVLRFVANELRGRHLSVRVEGHTDNVPIATPRFRSNWELSTARATSVIAEIAKLDILKPADLSAAGYGEFHPIASNETAEGRAQNRRVDLVVSVPVGDGS
jgi:chemotaxis protein MotB